MITNMIATIALVVGTGVPFAATVTPVETAAYAMPVSVGDVGSVGGW